MLASEKKRYLVVGLLLVSISFLFFQFFYSYHLYLKEQVLLFLYSSDYFLGYFSKPAWLTSYIGDFLTQFFYLRGGGAAVLSLLFFLEWLLGSFVFKKITKTNHATLWALLPAGADWILYGSVSHSVSVSVSFISVLIAFLIYSSIQNRKWSLIFAYSIALAGYWLAGSFFLVFPVLVVINEWKKEQYVLLSWIFIGVAIFLFPLIFRRYYLLTTLQTYMYPALEIKSLFSPGLLILSLLATCLLSKFEGRHPNLLVALVVLVFILGLVFGLHTNANFKLEKILALDSETYFGNTNRVLELSKKYGLKNRLATYYTNMALVQRGELPEKLMDYYQPAANGLLLPVAPTENWLTIFFSNEAFFLIGDMNLAQHSAMLGNTFSPYYRSSRMIKRLAEINLVNNDYPAATKYLRMLKKTLFHKKWALQKENINHLQASSKWLDEKQAQIYRSDTIRFPNDYLGSLNFLVKQNPHNQVALDYLLCYYLLNKDLKSFEATYSRYARKINRPTPSVYSEALLILLYSSHTPYKEVVRYGIPAQKVNDFVTYTQTFEKTKSNLYALEKNFGKTYWFYYHFATFEQK